MAKKNEKYIRFPEDVKYLVKLIPDNIPFRSARVEDTVYTEASLKNGSDGFVTLTAPGYYGASFVDKHFEFLLYCGDIKKLDK